MKIKKVLEDIYIFKRNMKAFAYGMLFFMCRVFPVNPYKIVMWTMEGKGSYGDSPKYIAEEIRYRNKREKIKFEIVWLVTSQTEEFPSDIKLVKASLWNRAYHLSTAGFWVGNTRTAYGTKKRKRTIYIQTWHAIAGIKPIGKQRGSKLPRIAQIISESDSKMIDYVLSGNEWSCKMWPDGLIYYGKFIRTGIPRCDILFSEKERMRQKYRDKYNLPLDTSIILYAPTFRGGSQNRKRRVLANIGHLDFERLVNALKSKFGGNWHVFLRLHPQVAEHSDKIVIEKKGSMVIDVSQYPDMNELMVASDILLTDYSSSIFESIIMNQVGFLYMEDREEYTKDRGNLMFDSEDLPFPIAYDMAGLEKQIEIFDDEEYKRKVNEFKEKLGIFEDGMASVRVVDFIEEKLNDCF